MRQARAECHAPFGFGTRAAWRLDHILTLPGPFSAGSTLSLAAWAKVRDGHSGEPCGRTSVPAQAPGCRAQLCRQCEHGTAPGFVRRPIAGMLRPGHAAACADPRLFMGWTAALPISGARSRIAASIAPDESAFFDLELVGRMPSARPDRTVAVHDAKTITGARSSSPS